MTAVKYSDIVTDLKNGLTLGDQFRKYGIKLGISTKGYKLTLKNKINTVYVVDSALIEFKKKKEAGELAKSENQITFIRNRLNLSNLQVMTVLGEFKAAETLNNREIGEIDKSVKVNQIV